MIIETYLDTSDLTSNQTLVVVDENGKRWDVSEALNNSGAPESGGQRTHRTEVVLERWTIELKGNTADETYDFGPTLPQVYKKCIVVFRSLYATARFLPADSFARKLMKSTKSNLRVNCRIVEGQNHKLSRDDPLTRPLCNSYSPVVGEFDLGNTDTPAGRFTATVVYRNECKFRVDDSEAILSSQFMGADEGYFKPSLGNRSDHRRGSDDYFESSLTHRSDDRRQTARAPEIGSLPTHHHSVDEREPIQAYGSMSTFHGNAPPLGSSPISALRAQRTMGSDTSSPPVRVPVRPRPTQIETSSSRALGAINMARRPSVTFNAFKAGSLASSPGPGSSMSGDMLPPSSPHSLSRYSSVGTLNQARNRSSLTAGMPASLRANPATPIDTAAMPIPQSPKPPQVSRYSSSFSNRHRKMSSYGGASKLDDDQGSSGKQSLSSSAQPGSGMLTELGGGGSSGSLQTDDDQISDFLKVLEKNKNRSLQSTDPTRTVAQLSKFRTMQESNAALTESMTSSAMLHRSSSTSSRQLSSVPAMVAATSLSTSSSPGKPVSPHTPHTPAIPSRLSANSIVDYSQPRRVDRLSRITSQADSPASQGSAATNAIDIPSSPRFYAHARRSSSVSQQHRSLAVDEDNRSVSLGDTDREPPTLSSLRGLGPVSGEESSSSGARERILQPAPELQEPPSLTHQFEQAQDAEEGPQPPRGLVTGSVNAPYRPRIGRVSGRGVTPPQGGSYTSLRDRDSGSGSNMSERPGSRYSFTRPVVDNDDEPLLFDMSEIGRGQDSRRSLEEARGGYGGAGSLSERGGYDAIRGGESGSSSRRGSRRGWHFTGET